MIVNASNIRSCGSRDEARTTACGGYYVRAEIDRNKQFPHEADLRRLRSRTLTALVQEHEGRTGPRPVVSESLLDKIITKKNAIIPTIHKGCFTGLWIAEV